MNSNDPCERLDPDEARRRLALWPTGPSRAGLELLDSLLDQRNALRPQALTEVVNELSHDMALADQPEFRALLDTLRAATTDTPTELADPIQIGWMAGSLRAAEWVMPKGFDLFFIEGDVDVEGVWSDAGDCDGSGVVTMGSLRAGHVLNSGFLLVGGDLLTRALMSCSGNDAYLWVHGDCVATELVLENGQYMRCGGALRAPLIVSVHNRLDAAGGVHGRWFDHEPESRYRSLFLPAYRTERELTEWDGQAWLVQGVVPAVDFDAVWRDLAWGRRVLAGSAK